MLHHHLLNDISNGYQKFLLQDCGVTSLYMFDNSQGIQATLRSRCTTNRRNTSTAAEAFLPPICTETCSPENPDLSPKMGLFVSLQCYGKRRLMFVSITMPALLP